MFRITTARCAASLLTPLLPLQELPEQRLAPGGIVADGGTGVGQELVELAALRLGGAPMPIEPIIRCLEALPAGNRQADAGFLPFRMPWRLMKLLDAQKNASTKRATLR